jgi:hypothetical protein
MRSPPYKKEILAQLALKIALIVTRAAEELEVRLQMDNVLNPIVVIN